jgi:hypothetical protein
MNTLDFGHLSDRDHTRGICMWVGPRDPLSASPKGEWCAKPLTVENYRGSFHQPTGYRYGALYGIHVPNGMPEYDSLWMCADHRLEFLKLNSGGNLGTTIWQMDHNGKGKDVTWVPMYEVSVRIRSNLDTEELSSRISSRLDWLTDNDANVESWTYLKVVGT